MDETITNAPGGRNASLPVARPLELIIAHAQGREQTFHLQLLQDGQVCASHTLSRPACHTFFALVDGFRQLCKPGGESTSPRSPSVAGEGHRQLLLQSLGVELFHLWMAPLWSAMAGALSGPQSLVLTIVSNAPDILNIPWELLCGPDGRVSGWAGRVLLRRRPMACADALDWSEGGSLPGPLRILFASAAPTGFHWVDEEKFRAVLPLQAAHPRPVVLQAVTRRALQSHLQAVKPHLLYLTGPALISGEQGFFAFADEEGQADVCSAAELAQEILAISPRSLVVVAGREEGRPPPVAAVAAICQGLVSHGVERALAWPTLLTDPFSGDFLGTFLYNARDGATVDQAIDQARRAIQPGCEQVACPAWALPVLYARSSRTPPFNLC
ncbi:MAG: CHAT domain-containing protein [Magnetococcus sp. XQGC-1]